MGGIMRSLVTFLFLILFVNAAGANSNCRAFSAPLSGGFCVYPSGKSKDVLYYFHGKDGSEKYWEDPAYYTAQIRQYWQQHQLNPPTVISVSFGPRWLLADKNESPYSGLLPLFIGQIMPDIERSFGGVRGRRMVMGESMGGFNTTQVALKTPYFERAAILCAPMARVSPFASASEIDRFIMESKAYAYHGDTGKALIQEKVGEMVQIAQAFFPTPQAWSSADPLQLVKAKDAGPKPRLYVAAGFHDAYALYEGNEEFSRRLKKNGYRTDWRPQWGGHCAMDIPSLARFFVAR